MSRDLITSSLTPFVSQMNYYKREILRQNDENLCKGQKSSTYDLNIFIKTPYQMVIILQYLLMVHMTFSHISTSQTTSSCYPCPSPDFIKTSKAYLEQFFVIPSTDSTVFSEPQSTLNAIEHRVSMTTGELSPACSTPSDPTFSAPSAFTTLVWVQHFGNVMQAQMSYASFSLIGF